MLSSLLRSVGIDYSSNEHVIILAEVFLALQFHNIYGQVRWNKGQYFVLAVILIHEPLSRSVDKILDWLKLGKFKGYSIYICGSLIPMYVCDLVYHAHTIFEVIVSIGLGIYWHRYGFVETRSPVPIHNRRSMEEVGATSKQLFLLLNRLCPALRQHSEVFRSNYALHHQLHAIMSAVLDSLHVVAVFYIIPVFTTGHRLMFTPYLSCFLFAIIAWGILSVLTILSYTTTYSSEMTCPVYRNGLWKVSCNPVIFSVPERVKKPKRILHAEGTSAEKKKGSLQEAEEVEVKAFQTGSMYFIGDFVSVDPKQRARAERSRAAEAGSDEDMTLAQFIKSLFGVGVVASERGGVASGTRSRGGTGSTERELANTRGSGSHSFSLADSSSSSSSHNDANGGSKAEGLAHTTGREKDYYELLSPCACPLDPPSKGICRSGTLDFYVHSLMYAMFGNNRPRGLGQRAQRRSDKRRPSSATMVVDMMAQPSAISLRISLMYLATAMAACSLTQSSRESFMIASVVTLLVMELRQQALRLAHAPPPPLPLPTPAPTAPTAPTAPQSAAAASSVGVGIDSRKYQEPS